MSCNNKIAKQMRFLFDGTPTADTITVLKKIIAEEAVFYPPDFFKKYVEDNKNNNIQIKKDYPYLFFAQQDGSNIPVRMRRGNTAYWKEIEEIITKQKNYFSNDQYQRLSCLIKLWKEKTTKVKNSYSIEIETKEDIKITDNANNIFNTEFEKIGYKFEKGKYEICHIGEDTCSYLEFFAAIPNIVYLPRWISSATDYSNEIRFFLASKSYSLYAEILKKNNINFDFCKIGYSKKHKDLFQDFSWKNDNAGEK